MSAVASQAQTSTVKVEEVERAERSDITGLVARFKKILGPEWDDYQTSVSLFLVGKLARDELMEEISHVLEKAETKKLHNQLLIAMLANSFKAQPLDGTGGGFGSSKKRKNMSKSSHWDQIKKVVLSLPIRERMRIKAITRESGKKGLTSNIIVQTRQALVPKVPILTATTPEEQNKNLARTMVSVKDILDMVNAPLCTENYELPERTGLRDRMIGYAREHGVLGSVSMKAADILYLGLQFHLKSLISSALDNVGATANPITKQENGEQNEKSRKRKRIVLTLEDMFDSFTLTPHLIQPYGSMDFLTDCMLKNDDDYDILTRYKDEPFFGTKKPEEQVIETAPGGPFYVIPEKLTPVSYLLRPRSGAKNMAIGSNDTEESNTSPKQAPISGPSQSKELGTSQELLWLINDLLS